MNMAAAALAQEKVWFDKPSYDKAERLYFERLAKLAPTNAMCSKITGSCTPASNTSVIENSEPWEGSPNASLTTVKSTSKSKRMKKKKTANADISSTESSKTSNNECQTRNNAKNNTSKDNLDGGKQVQQQTESIIEKDKSDGGVDTKEKESATDAKKYKAKEAKEKKNKADKKQRNCKEEEKCDVKEPNEQPSQQGNQQSTCPILPAGGSLANEVAKARQHIKQSLQCMDGIAALAGVPSKDDNSRVANLEKENEDLRNTVKDLAKVVGALEDRVKALEEIRLPYLAICPQKPESPEPEEKPAVKEEEDDDDVDLFGSDSEGEDAEAAKIREQRLAAYAAKKSKKPVLIAKSNIILDVKPWDDETDMKALEVEVRKVECDGLLWGAAKLVPLAYGIHKLQISCVVEDEKVSVDWLTEKIQEIEDFVQSVDIAAFNKV